MLFALITFVIVALLSIFHREYLLRPNTNQLPMGTAARRVSAARHSWEDSTMKLETSKDYWVIDMHRFSWKKSSKSQGSQDEYFKTIFNKVGTTNRFFVEFGFNEPSYTSGGSGANTWNLYDQGWRGLLLDGDRNNSAINLHAHFLFSNNIGRVLKSYKVPLELDLLSCDMDSHDLFVFNAILEAGFRPRVITTEFNSNYPLEFAITQIDPTKLGETSEEFQFVFKQCAWGASASALKIVAQKYGYTLVGKVGILDLVWLRDDLLHANWEIPAFDWFFDITSNSDLRQTDRQLGKLFHKRQTSSAIFDFLLDYAVYEREGDVFHAREAARQQILSSNLKCFEQLEEMRRAPPSKRSHKP
jgi:hypothetical protein